MKRESNSSYLKRNTTKKKRKKKKEKDNYGRFFSRRFLKPSRIKILQMVFKQPSLNK
jgi:hypothetical protein